MSPKVPTRSPLPGRSERIAAILNQPQVVFLHESGDRVKIEDIAQGVGDHDGLCFFAARGFELSHVDFIGRQGDIHENRYQAILNNRD